MDRQGQDDEARLRLRLFGPFAAWWRHEGELDVRSAKAKGLFALCMSAPDGKRTRALLHDTLWGLSGASHGRASLRQTLSAMRRLLGDDFNKIFLITNETVGLRLPVVDLVGGPGDGVFLEGLAIPVPAFNVWLDEMRRNPPPAVSGRPSATRVQRPPAPAGPAARTMRGATSQDRPSRPAIEGPGGNIHPIVAVIPFGAPNRADVGAHLSDAIAQDVTRSLSRSPLLRVISHLSSRDPRLQSAPLAQIRQLIAADYVIGGLVRLDGERFRLDVDLIDTTTGELMWTRDFVGALPKFLAGTDTVIQRVADVTFNAIVRRSLEPVAITPLPDIASHRLLMAGITLMHRTAFGSFERARRCLEVLIARAPQHAILHAWLAKWHTLSLQQGWTVDAATDARRGLDHVTRALELDPNCSFALTICAVLHQYMHRLDDAAVLHDQALEIDPNNAMAWLLKGTLHMFRDEGALAVEHTMHARTLSPLDPHRYLFDSVAASAQAVAGNLDAALELARQSRQANRRHASTLRVITYALEMMGRHDEAQDSASELLRVVPNFTVGQYLATHPSVDAGSGRQWAEILRRAGVPAN